MLGLSIKLWELQLARRASPHQKNFKSDQKAFRKTLKACKGDEACLAMGYQNRIAELQGFVSELNTSADEATASLNAGADTAHSIRDSQLDQPDSNPVGVAPVSTPEGIEVLPQELTEQPPIAPEGVVTQPAKPATDSSAGWGTVALVLMAVVGVAFMFVSWLFKAVRRCPRCTKWWAGQVYDRDHESHVEYKTKEFVDEHRNRHNVLTGRTRKKRQVAVTVSKSTNYLRCQMCQHEWSVSYSSRSS